MKLFWNFKKEKEGLGKQNKQTNKNSNNYDPRKMKLCEFLYNFMRNENTNYYTYDDYRYIN